MSLRTIIVVLFSLLFGFNSMMAYGKDSSIKKQREIYQKWLQNYTTLSDTEQLNQLVSLKDYPLYPYARYQYLKAHLATASINQVNQFVRQNPDFPLSSSLMQSYVELLTEKKDWQNISKLSIDNSLVTKCRYKYALFQQGKKTEAFKDVASLWLSDNDLPSACNDLFNAWDQSGAKSVNLILLRLELVLSKNNIKLARYLTNQLPSNYGTLKKNLLAVLDDPQNLTAFVKNMSVTPFSKNVVMLSFPRLANRNPELANTLIPTLVKRLKLTQEQEIKLQRSIALNYFNSSATKEQVTWRDHFISEHSDVGLLERRIRLALKDNQLDQVAYWINLLPKTHKQKDEWRYWQAVILEKDNQQADADKILQSLMEQRGFYAMYSAQKLKQTYHFNFEYPVIDKVTPKEELARLSSHYAKLPVIQRIEELRYFGKIPEAIAEWRYFLYKDNNPKQYAEIARYAYLRGWGEHSVQATIAGKLWDNWLERFPLVHQQHFDHFTKDKSIPLSFALAISRQESGLDPTVQSPSGAKGLMQLLPNTAKESAKKIALQNYHSSEQLYDPETNIQLGTYYLNYVYQLFDDNRVLAAAAYNAGPNRVNRWLQDTADGLEVIAFIESIPFTETRNYVKSVLVFDYIYQLILKNKPQTILNTKEVQHIYHKEKS